MLEVRPGVPGEVLTHAKDEKQRRRAGRQTRRKQQRRHARISVAPAEGASANPWARIIIMIWWTNIAWLSQIRAISRRMAWRMPPVIAILRATATEHSSAAETCSGSRRPGCDGP